MKRSTLLVAILVAITPLIGHASNIEYARIIEKTDADVLIKKSTFTEDTYYRCAVPSGACTAVSATTSIIDPVSATTPAFMLAYRSLLPNGASRLTRSPDGRYIAFYIPATQSRGERTFGVMDTTDLSVYTKKEPLSYWDLLTEGIRVFAFSPDSKTLLYISDTVDDPIIYRVDMASLSKTTKSFTSAKLFSREYSIADVQFVDSDSILFIANRDNPYAWSLYRYSISGQSLTKIAGDVSYDVNLSKTGAVFTYGVADAKGVRPMMYNPATGSITEFDFPREGTTESRGKAVTTLKNNLTGVFLLEKSGQSDTLLVFLHGGPYRQTSVGYHPYLSYGGYDWMLETARRSDVGVLKLDYPGSSGFGRKFAESITGKVGVKDALDARVAITDFAKRNGYKNVYLVGNSYGGYLAMKLLVDTPSSFKGAMSIAGVMDWTTMLTALDTSIFNVQFGGTAGEQNFDKYAAASIYNNVSRLNGQSVVLVHGDKDLTIPYRQSANFATFLGQNGVSHTFITLNDEGHIFKKPDSFESVCTALLNMMKKSTSLCAID